MNLRKINFKWNRSSVRSYECRKNSIFKKYIKDIFWYYENLSASNFSNLSHLKISLFLCMNITKFVHVLPFLSKILNRQKRLFSKNFVHSKIFELTWIQISIIRETGYIIHKCILDSQDLYNMHAHKIKDVWNFH